MIEVLSLHFTDQCTRRCPGCYMRGRAGAVKDPYFFIPFASIARQLGIKQIALGGGEPTLFPEFVSEFGAACRQNGEILNMTTNGDGFTPENLNFFKELTLVSFSIDKHKIRNLGDLQSLFGKMHLAREAGLKVGANLQLDPFIIDNLYEMLGELFRHCDRTYLLQPKPTNLLPDAEIKTKLQAASCLYEQLYADESLLMKLGLSETCGRGQKMVSVDYCGGVSCCSFDKSFASLNKARDLVEIIDKHYPFPKTTQCPFL